MFSYTADSDSDFENECFIDEGGDESDEAKGAVASPKGATPYSFEPEFETAKMPVSTPYSIS